MNMKKILLSLLAMTLVLSACDSKGNAKDTNREDIVASYPEEDEINDDLDLEDENEDEEGLSLGEQKRNILDRVEVNDKKAQKVKKNQSIDLFKELAGKEFASFPGSGSDVIYFHENGNIDGAALYGNGNIFSTCLYKAKFDLVKKIDNVTYEIKLTSLDYQTPVDKEEKVKKNGMEFIHNYMRCSYFDKNVGKTFKIHLPKTKVNSLSEGEINSIEMTDNQIANGQINVFALSSHDENYGNKDYIIMSELIDKKKKSAKKDSKNYLTYFEAGWKRAMDEISKEYQDDYASKDEDEPTDDLDFDYLAKMVLDSYEDDKKGGKDIIDLDKAQEFLKKNADILAYMKSAEKFKDKFKDIGISGLDLKADKDQPIIKIRGTYIDEKEIEPDNDMFGLWDNFLRASLNSGENIIIKLKFLGDRRNHTYDAADGSKVVNVWALPLGVYKMKDDNGKDIRVFEFVSGEGIQDTAFKLFGDDYNK